MTKTKQINSVKKRYKDGINNLLGAESVLKVALDEMPPLKSCSGLSAKSSLTEKCIDSLRINFNFIELEMKVQRGMASSFLHTIDATKRKKNERDEWVRDSVLNDRDYQSNQSNVRSYANNLGYNQEALKKMSRRREKLSEELPDLLKKLEDKKKEVIPKWMWIKREDRMHDIDAIKDDIVRGANLIRDLDDAYSREEEKLKQNEKEYRYYKDKEYPLKDKKELEYGGQYEERYGSTEVSASEIYKEQSLKFIDLLKELKERGDLQHSASRDLLHKVKACNSLLGQQGIFEAQSLERESLEDWVNRNIKIRQEIIDKKEGYKSLIEREKYLTEHFDIICEAITYFLQHTQKEMQCDE